LFREGSLCYKKLSIFGKTIVKNPLSMSSRSYNFIDRTLMHLDQAIRTLSGQPCVTTRPDPALAVEDTELAAAEQRRSSRLMRVNHTGEVCAQALYQGQALTARSDFVRTAMAQSSIEENDHLVWCKNRIDQLHGHTSLLNPLFYAGSFSIGAIAGKMGDHWSLGFVAETEQQVVNHLDKHIQRLPSGDSKSRIILATMQQDESQHAGKALAAGGKQLPQAIRGLMKVTSKIMTKTTYWL
jgi:ubiquinone biosynthesis monooxygenase Coq7